MAMDFAFIGGADFLQRGIGRDARAHVGGGEAFGHAGCVEQVFRMRDEDVFGIAAGDLDAELARLGADVFLVALAGGALAAADPREDDEALADLAAFEQGLRIRADSRERAFDLVAQRVRQRAALGPVELVAIAEVDMAVLQVDVRMADAGVGDLHHHFRALRRRDVGGDFLERFAVGDDGLALHWVRFLRR